MWGAPFGAYGVPAGSVLDRATSAINEAVAEQRADMRRDAYVDRLMQEQRRKAKGKPWAPGQTWTRGRGVEAGEDVETGEVELDAQMVPVRSGPNWRIIGAAAFLTIAGLGSYMLWKRGKSRSRRRK